MNFQMGSAVFFDGQIIPAELQPNVEAGWRMWDHSLDIYYDKPITRVENGMTRWVQVPLCHLYETPTGYRIEAAGRNAEGRMLFGYERIIELHGVDHAEAKAEAEILLRGLGWLR